MLALPASAPFRHFLRLSPGFGAGLLAPIKRPFTPNVDVTDDQRSEKSKYLKEGYRAVGDP